MTNDTLNRIDKLKAGEEICIDALCGCCNIHTDLTTDDLKALADRVRWIPCSERLPNRNELAAYSSIPCLTTRKGLVEVLCFNHEHECWDDATGDDFECDISEVDAWMPLPEPYQEATNDDLNRMIEAANEYRDTRSGFPINEFAADFALEQIEADRRRIVAELTAQIDENKNTIGDWAWGREEGLEIAINIVKGESK